MLIYQIITLIIVIFYPLILIFRAFTKKENLHSIINRFGLFCPIFTRKNVIYIHAASVGEAKSAFKMIETLIKDGYFVKITVMTKTSFSMLMGVFGKNKAIHISYIPFDFAPFVLIFLAILRPKIVIFIESEIWANMIFFSRFFAKKRVFMVNLRMSVKSISRWHGIKKLINFNPIGYFKHIFTAEEKIVENIKIFNKNVDFIGNIKADYVPIYNPKIDIKKYIQNEVLLISSSHEGEEEIALKAILDLGFQVIIAPRRPHRAIDVLNIVKNYDKKPILLTNFLKNPHEITKDDILIVNEIGCMAHFYDIAKLVFVCGSFVPNIGGHNPLESIFHKKPVIIGKFHENCKENVNNLSGKCLEVSDNENITKITQNIIQNYNKYIQNIEKFVSSQQCVSENIINKIMKY
ncbi:3-deoxy-D-manno-octulosonic acid transferase [Candidatus Deianiraea vastatrix]|uniref:3-deoxy-D-manno-octulosonic acid transferase n=1 Tax=Candidatus Deianiraea vastatrix TaxID=2163644 RepID=A0A5B8XC03_9RICK|nr:glycosyltransferase N-terminal domain-containing protein [Candidatus Deianiraea vastatrix]QED22882.1 3-deoxy-D-manno-octulosonic acid transferase [Candidatus Deianiraea vastatrix]